MTIGFWLGFLLNCTPLSESNTSNSTLVARTKAKVVMSSQVIIIHAGFGDKIVLMKLHAFITAQDSLLKSYSAFTITITHAGFGLVKSS